MSLPLSPTMVELFFEAEKEDARRVLREEMDSCMDTIFGQMKRKLMQLVESGRGLGDPMDRGLGHYKSSNDFNSILATSTNSHDQFRALNASNPSQQNVSNNPQHHNQQQIYYSSSNTITNSTLTNSQVPDNDLATSNQFQNDDEITVKNELGETVNIIPNNESIPSSSAQSPNDEQSNNNNNIDDYCFDEEDEDCDCPECVGDLFVKMEEEEDDVQLIENLDESSNPRPTKRARIENEPAQPNNNKPNQTNHPNQFITISLKCTKCTQMFQDKNALNAHLKAVHSIEKYRCLYKDCNRSYDNKFHLTLHYTTTHPTQPNVLWPCGYCSMHYKNSRSLLSHYLQQHEEGVFKCSYLDCQFVGKFKQTVIHHYAHNHREVTCQFPGCAKRFQNASKLKTHQRSHLVVKQYRCKWPNCLFDCAYLDKAMHHIRGHLSANLVNGNLNNPKYYLEVIQSFK